MVASPHLTGSRRCDDYLRRNCSSAEPQTDGLGILEAIRTGAGFGRRSCAYRADAAAIPIRRLASELRRRWRPRNLFRRDAGTLSDQLATHDYLSGFVFWLRVHRQGQDSCLDSGCGVA